MRRLLIVDDDPAVADTVGAVARRGGFKTDIVGTLNELLERLDTWQPSHLIIDLIMPGKDGVEIIRELARRNSRVGVIILSGAERRIVHTARRTAEQRGLNVLGALTKPFVPDALLELLARDAPIDKRIPRDGPKVHAIEEFMLLSALRGNELRMVYQPCVTAERRIVGFEAQLRWTHPHFGELLPSSFLPSAVSYGAYEAMTLQAFDRSMGWLRRFGLGSSLELYFNLATKDLLSTSLVDNLRWLCESHEVAPNRVTLAFAETHELFASPDARDALTRLNMTGFRLAIAAFGTGYSSMTHLARLPISELRVDRSFVAGALSSPIALGIVTSIIRLARDLNLTSAADGVEDHETWALLQSLGCDRVQGNYLYRPLESDAAVELVQGSASSDTS